ncbi:MAG: transglycosylase SLT domain-containing protein [Rhodanobacter sp.]|jgi:membrane-bound lytic murein transglycosylase D|nr:transglycosylase SLT domain-containing protein [Rhodanobacter sp.]
MKRRIRHWLTCTFALAQSACITSSSHAPLLESVAQSATHPTDTAKSTTAALQETAISPWPRLRTRFVMQSCDYRPQVQRWITMYTKDPRAFAASWKSAMPFLLIVTDEIERRNLPGEFAMLPYLESSYEPIASQSGSAMGMWQIMPDAAKAVRLAVNADYDARLNALDSTRGALKLVRRYYKKFGDWRIADMAFNTGENRMRQLLEGRNARTLTAEELSQIAPQSIMHSHLDRLLALSCVVNDPARFGVTLPEPTRNDRLQEVVLKSGMDLRLAAHLAAVPADSVKRWNAGYRHNRMPANAPHRLLLPADNVARFRIAADAVPTKLWGDWREELTTDSGGIGTWASRIGVPVAVLAAANALDENATIAPTTTLLLPGREPEPAIEDNKPPTAPPRQQVASESNQPSATPPRQQVASVNNQPPAALPRQPVASESNQPSTAPPRQQVASESNQPSAAPHHQRVVIVDNKPPIESPRQQVASADNQPFIELPRQQVAKADNQPLVELPRQQVAKADNQAPAELPRHQAAKADNQPPAELPRQPVARADNQPPAESPRQHIVVAGDTPSDIAHRYSIPLDHLFKLNPQARTRLRPGDRLLLPGG